MAAGFAGVVCKAEDYLESASSGEYHSCSVHPGKRRLQVSKLAGRGGREGDVRNKLILRSEGEVRRDREGYAGPRAGNEGGDCGEGREVRIVHGGLAFGDVGLGQRWRRGMPMLRFTSGAQLCIATGSGRAREQS